jgi:hypothetical protein
MGIELVCMISEHLHVSLVPPPVPVNIAKPFPLSDPNGNPTVFDATVYYIQMQ